MPQWWPLGHLRKLLPAPEAPLVPTAPTPVNLLARAWSGLEALIDAATAAMESYNQWIIEMLADDSPRTPSWAVAVPDSDAQGGTAAATPSPPASGASSTHWATTTFAIDDPSVMLNSLSDSSDDEDDDGEGDENEEGAPESPLMEDHVGNDALEEEVVAEGDDGAWDPQSNTAGESGESEQLASSEEVRALKAACDFYMHRCDQLRDAVSNLSTELVGTRAVLERRRELELLRGRSARVIKLVTGDFSLELKRVLVCESSDQSGQSVSADEGSNGSEHLSVLQSFVQGLQSPATATDPSFRTRATHNGDSTQLASTSADAAVSLNEGAARPVSEHSGEMLEEQDIVVPIRPEGTTYQQLTELPVKRDDGNWHRHVLQVLKAERELRRRQQRPSDPPSSDSNADTASFHSTDDDGDGAGGHRRRLVLRSSSSSLSEASNTSLTA